MPWSTSIPRSSWHTGSWDLPAGLLLEWIEPVVQRAMAAAALGIEAYPLRSVRHPVSTQCVITHTSTFTAIAYASGEKR